MNLLPIIGIAAVGALVIASSGKKKKSTSDKGAAPEFEIIKTEQVWESDTPGFGKMVTYQILEFDDGTFLGRFIPGSHRGFEDKPSQWTDASPPQETAEDAEDAILELIESVVFSDMPSHPAEDDAMPVAMEGTIQGYEYEIVEYVEDGQVLGYVGAIRKADGRSDWRSVAEAKTAEAARLLTLEKIAILSEVDDLDSEEEDQAVMASMAEDEDAAMMAEDEVDEDEVDEDEAAAMMAEDEDEYEVDEDEAAAMMAEDEDE
jgi:hypothetical protein